MTGHRTGQKPQGVFYGWWILAAGTIVWALQSATYYVGISAFFTALINEFGWSRTSLSLVISMARLQGGIAAPAVGFLIDRVGPRRLMIVGFTLAGTGYILLSQATSIEMFSLIFVLVLSVGVSLGFSASPSAAVANWFIRRRSLAFGLMASGIGIGGLIVPIIAWSITTHGWRTTAIGYGILLLVSGIPLSMVMRHKPEPYGYLPDGDYPSASENPQNAGRQRSKTGKSAPSGSEVKAETRAIPAVEPSFTPKQALATRAFWTYSIMAAVRLSVTSGVGVHGIPAMEHMGFSREIAALIITVMTIISIPGRISFGWLADRYEKRYVIGICLVMLTIGVTALAYATDLTLVIVFLVFFSPAHGGLVTLDQAVISDYFGRKSFASISGLFQGITMWGTMAGPVVAGYVFDVNNSYQFAFQIFAALGLLATALSFLLRRPQPVIAPDIATG